jgi:hypothetical protein
MDWLCFKFHTIWISFDIYSIKNHQNYMIIFNGLNLMILDEISNDIQIIWNLKQNQFIRLKICL